MENERFRALLVDLGTYLMARGATMRQLSKGDAALKELFAEDIAETGELKRRIDAELGIENIVCMDVERIARTARS